MEEGGTDDCVYVPYSTAARLSLYRHHQQLYCDRDR